MKARAGGLLIPTSDSRSSSSSSARPGHSGVEQRQKVSIGGPPPSTLRGRYRLLEIRCSRDDDQTDRRQFRGCLEDWTIDQLVVDVVSFDEVSLPSER